MRKGSQPCLHKPDGEPLKTLCVERSTHNEKPLGWLSLFLIAILPLSGFAESLPLNTFSQTHHWKQTYNAHNRSIEIDIEIAIPEKWKRQS